MAEFQPNDLLAVLVKHNVEFIVVGGLGAFLQGSPQLTVDLDIVPDPVRDNLERLSVALTELEARVRGSGAPYGLPFRHDGISLGQSTI